MNDQPATRLQHAVVVIEQSGAAWKAGRASIRNGRIVVPAAGCPEGFFDRPAATYRIEAIDGSNRARSYPNCVLISRSAEEYVFD